MTCQLDMGMALPQARQQIMAFSSERFYGGQLQAHASVRDAGLEAYDLCFAPDLPVEFLDTAGFGFLEVGAATPRPQPGNPRPRLFRLTEDRAAINRFGFNNDGAAVVAQRLARLRARFGRNLPIIGVNIGKSKITSLEGAVADYEFSTRLLAQHADYLAVNVSSPNTPGLRDLQAVSALRPILQVVQRHAMPLRHLLRRHLALPQRLRPVASRARTSSKSNPTPAPTPSTPSRPMASAPRCNPATTRPCGARWGRA